MYDCIVIGSGGAGLTAAMTAAVGGASVLVLEASSRWGGSTAISAGEVWTPANHRMADLGVEDSAEEALRYCHPSAIAQRLELVDAFVKAAPEMARSVEASSPIVWQAMTSPDSFAERPGGRASARHLEVSPLTVGELAPLKDSFWLPSYPAIFTNEEVFKLRLLFGGEFPQALAEERTRTGQVCTGIGLIVGLMQGCQSLGVEFRRNARVLKLLHDGGDEISCGEAISGVVVESEGARQVINTRYGVILASGGFEWNEALRNAEINAPLTHPVSPPIHYGDGLRMAAEVGGALAHTNEAWCWPAFEQAEKRWPGTQSARHALVLAERCMPHVIWVNRNGQRFVNESSHNCALAFAAPDNLPVWAIADAQFRRRYPLAGALANDVLPANVVQAPDLAALADAISIDKGALKKTINRFNTMVLQGRDQDFERGNAAYDRYYGDAKAQHPSLGSIEQAPFYAMPVLPGAVGTKGGVVVDERARVLDERNQPLQGLWAAGNVVASHIGPGTIAPGLTLGLALTWGYIAGKNVAI